GSGLGVLVKTDLSHRQESSTGAPWAEPAGARFE
ncbi:hypothetical protein RRG08_029083, partial [Elysia crispata]